MKFGGIISFGVVLTVLLSVAGCSGGRQEERVTRRFPEVMVPEIYAGDYEDALDFTAEHFWDDFTDTLHKYVCDSAHIGGVACGEVEQEVSSYANLLQMIPLDQARKNVRSLYGKLEACEKADSASNVFESLVSLLETYLYDPNSPVRDEDIYGAFAEMLSQHEGFDEATRGRYSFQAQKSSLNARGTEAADFWFSDAQGRMISLHEISADYTLLFFSNPGCEACKEIITVLSEELNVSEMIAAGKLAVLNIYIDEDLESWYDYMPIYPTDWYNGYDPDGIIRSDGLYYVRAIPSLYLLDADKRVLLKDASNDKVFNALAMISGWE